jgi:hypothetical protein
MAFQRQLSKTTPVNIPDEKECGMCGLVLPVKGNFRYKGVDKRRLQGYCSRCLYLFQMRRWNSQKVKAIAYLGGKCKRCGSVDHPACFDFHHRDPSIKEVDWSKLRIRSWDKIKIELDKCDLLCCRCHRMDKIDPNLWPKEIKWQENR